MKRSLLLTAATLPVLTLVITGCTAAQPDEPDATARMAAPAPPTAILMIEPRLGLDDHPLTIAAAQLGAWLVVIAEDAPTLPIGAATHVLGVQVPFTSQSLGPVISRVVRDRPQG